MKINRLCFSGFGPYKEKQEIDFASLNEHKIFLITGPTGSGKTTIFDAICYALYGKSSGNLREGEDLVSQHKSVDDLTFVELDFTVKGKRYVIYRQPKQEYKKSKGEGTVIKNVVATLEDLQEGKITTNVKEVNEKIQTILGIDATQFRQIVMLPQGEFRQLLEANSLEKEQIFRKIFKTDFYKLVQEQLREKVKQIKGNLEDAQKAIVQEIEHINPYQNQELIALISEENYNYLSIISKIKEVNQTINQDYEQLKSHHEKIIFEVERLTTKITETKKLMEEQDKLNQFRTQLSELEAQKEEIAAKEEKVSLAKAADKLYQVESLLIKTKNKYQELNQQIKLQKEYELEFEKTLQKAEEELQRVEADYLNLDQLKITAQKLEQTLVKLQEWHAEQQKLSKILEKIADSESNLQKNETALAQLVLNEKNLKAKIVEIEKETEKITEVMESINQYEKQISNLEAIINQLQEAISLGEKQKQLIKDLEPIEIEYRHKKNLNDEHYDHYLKSQAGILAQNLKPNEPCPVCGSTIHPVKAQLTTAVMTLEEIDLEKEQVEALRKEYDQRLHIHKTYFEQRNKILEQLKNHITFDEEAIEDILREYQFQVEVLHTKIQDSLVKKQQIQDMITNLSNLKTKALQKEQEIKTQNQAILMLKENHQALLQEHTAIKTLYEQLAKEYQLESSDEAEVKSELEVLRTRIVTISKAYEQAKKQVESCNLELNKTQATIQELKRQGEALLDELNTLEARFNEALAQSNFANYQAYEQIICERVDIEDLEEAIRKYHEQVKFLTHMVKTITKELEHVTISDLTVLTEEKERLNEQLNQLAEDKQHLHMLYFTNSQALLKIERLYQGFKTQEEEYRHLAYVENIVSGNNIYKLSFERYVLTVYFDEIIAHANERLKEMTQGRYLLVRDDEYEGGRGQKGLDLLVYDAYTSMKRSVKTLSGGESFIASLALALGLSNVVSSYAGGIELETIFIDEGFGSLDAMALDQAIATLNKLKDYGRVIGLISHVQELKEQINSQVIITKTNTGSHIKLSV